jgi:hypothetical protein
MFVKALGIFGRNKEAKPPALPLGGPSVAFPRGGLVKLINPAGRVSLQMLQRLVKAVPVEDFARFVPSPCLVGSAIQLGTLDLKPPKGNREMNRTVLFEPSPEAGEPAAASSESLRHAVYPLVRSEIAATGSVFTIGRIDGNHFIMPDYAISKKHAVIEAKRGSYFLRDLASTNGTLLNGARVRDKPIELHDRDVVSFARYEFAFLFPPSLYETLRQAG